MPTGGGLWQKLCPNCKLEVCHKPDKCFELYRNSVWCPSGWTGKLWWCGEANSVERDINKSLLIDKLLVLFSPVACIPHPTQYNSRDTVFVNLGASNIYLSKEAPIKEFDAAASKVNVGTATGQVQCSVGTDTLEIPNTPSVFPCTGNVMPSFKNTLIVIGSIFDADCKVVFTKYAIGVYDPQQRPIITRCLEPTG